MFDTVAVPRREDRARRAGSLLLSALLLGSLLGLALTWVPPAALPEAVLPPMPVLVELRAPELPGPPVPPSGGGGGRRGGAPAPAVAPPEVLPDAFTPAPVPPDPSGSGVPTEEPPGEGPAGGEGPPGGPPGEGPPGGPPGGGSGTPGPVMRHHTDLVPLKRVEPRFPEAARSFARGEERCTVRVVVDEHGEPAQVTPRTCPVLFQRAAIEAAEQWRWAPYLVDGQPSRAGFDLQFVFRLHD